MEKLTKAEILRLRRHGDMEHVVRALRAKHSIVTSRQAIGYWLLKPGADTRHEEEITSAFAEIFVKRAEKIQGEPGTAQNHARAKVLAQMAQQAAA